MAGPEPERRIANAKRRPGFGALRSLQIRCAANPRKLPDVERRSAHQAAVDVRLREEIVGTAEVRDVFRSPRFGQVAGCMVVDGAVGRNKKIRVLRDNVVIFEGELESLRRFKDDVGEVRNGLECGIGVRNYNDVRVGDRIEVFESREVARAL